MRKLLKALFILGIGTLACCSIAWYFMARSAPELQDSGSAALRPAESESPCQSAFKKAAAVDSMHDTWRDFDQAVERCASIEEWIGGVRSVASSNANSAIEALASDPVQILLSRCQDPGTPVKGPACDEVFELYPDGVYYPPYDELEP